MRKRRNPFEVPRRRRFPALALVSILVSLAVVVAGGALIILWPRISTHAAGAAQDPNPNCSLIVPAHPLTAQGLATPYQLVATNPKDGPCHEANSDQAAFVQGSIFNFDTGEIDVYNPLVVDLGTRPAVNPVVPKFPRNAVVALWFGYNGDNLTLRSANNSLQEGHCVNGVKNGIFGQYAYCNASLFFGEVNQAVSWGKLTPPPLGVGKDGKPCMTVRDFGIVDQDQSDNVTSNYLVTKDGRIAQMTAANQKRLPGAQPLSNGSDNALLNVFVDPALGCTPWTAPDLADPGSKVTALPLNEVQAMVYQQAPVALVPSIDPMVLDANNAIDLNKTNAYRAGVDQPRALDNTQADGKAYCQNLVDTGAARMVLDAPLTAKATTPDPATGDTLFTFLAQRYADSYTNLNCQDLLGKPSPIATTQNADGVAVSATFNGKPIDTGTAGTGGGGTGQGPDCNIDGQTVKGCAGTATVNGQSCTISFADNTVTMVCNKKN